jgi:hypothetical protein
VIDGYVTARAARELYGVALSNDNRKIDMASTAALRRRMWAAKGDKADKGVSVAAE